MYLPEQSAILGQWNLWDYGARTGLSPAAAGGAATVTFPQVPYNELWLVDRMVVQLSPSAHGNANLYVDLVDAEHLIDTSYIGDLDVADFASPHLLQSTQQLIVQWPGAADGAFGRARMQYTILRKAEG